MLNDFIDQFGPSTVGGLAAGAIYALIALGYTMVYGVLRLINFAHSEIFMIGTFSGLAVIMTLGVSEPQSGIALIGLLLLLSVVAMVGSGAAAVALEQIAYRPLRKKGSSRLAALISAIGASIFLQELFAIVVIPHLYDHPRGRDNIGTQQLLDKEPLFTLGNTDVRPDHLIVIVASIAMMIALDFFVNRSRIGRGIRATAQNPETAVLMGINIDRIVRITFFVGGCMAGIAGLLYLLQFEETRYNIGFVLGIKAFTAAVLGGIGNLRGALLGGLALGLIENWGAIFFGSAWKDVIAFTVLVVILMFRPTGILGESLQVARA
ncbi:branched-chain amino acid ABC transporter permease [Rhizohabitans arisaemae]|uniref:branched-chain amino acid ABC transporter permease n=1 Tax=Rhizohabitans arisaemae TaxID=2720610 RepID=UPI0024B07FE0|nr:branched-chain amino acid ABC transporter permease [Rhizohabitans arisaemae]